MSVPAEQLHWSCFQPDTAVLEVIADNGEVWQVGTTLNSEGNPVPDVANGTHITLDLYVDTGGGGFSEWRVYDGVGLLMAVFNNVGQTRRANPPPGPEPVGYCPTVQFGEHHGTGESYHSWALSVPSDSGAVVVPSGQQRLVALDGLTHVFINTYTSGSETAPLDWAGGLATRMGWMSYRVGE